MEGEIMRETIIKRLFLEDAKLFCTIKENRFLLANCNAVIEVRERQTQIKALGGTSVKKRYLALILCDDVQLNHDMDDDFLKSISAFDLQADMWQKSGLYERMTLYNLDLEEIEVGGVLTFSTENPQNLKAIKTEI